MNYNLRQKDAYWFDKINDYKYHIAGCGATGSWLALFLARANAKQIIVHDDDYVSEHNIGGQFFKTTDVDSLKVVCTVDNVKEFVGKYVNYQIEKVTLISSYYTDKHHIYIAAMDNMEGRKLLFDWFKNGNNDFFIDVRLHFNQYEIYFVTRDRIDDYVKYLYDSNDPDLLQSDSCTTTQTTYLAAKLAANIVEVIVNYISGAIYPFKTLYISNACLTELEM